MSKRTLTEASVAALKPTADRQSEHPDSKVFGLMLRVSPGGTKAWVMRYAAPSGERRRMKLGTYPALGLAEARLKALKVRVEIEEDTDPAQLRRERRARSETLDELAGEYWAAAAKGLHGGRGRPKRPGSIAVERQRYEKHAAPRIGSRPFNKLVKGDIRALERALSETDLSQHTIAGVLGSVRALLAFAVHEERIPANPAVGVIRTAALEGRDRYWPANQARAIYGALCGHDGDIDPSMKLLLRFLALTLVRKNEARLARWEEIDLEARTWTVPGGRMKSGRPHVVPLSLEALGVLAEAGKRLGRTGWVFRSSFERPGVKELQPFNMHAPYVALRRLCQQLKVQEGGPHDWRRTGATLLTGEALGIRRFVVSMLLAHSTSEGAAVTRFYDRNDYLSEKRMALERWAAMLSRANLDAANAA